MTAAAVTDRMLTTAETCQLLRCSRRTLNNYINRGRITPVRISQRRNLYRYTDLEQLLQPEQSDAEIIRQALQSIAEHHADEQRPLCPDCGRRRVNRGQSICTYCQQNREAQLEHKRRWWEAHGNDNRARRRQEQAMATNPDHDHDHDDQQDHGQTPAQTEPTHRQPLRRAIPPRPRP